MSRICVIPVFIIGMFLTLIGLEVLWAPDPIIVTPAHQIAFEQIGRIPLGIALLVTGAWTALEGYRCSVKWNGLFMGVLNSVFWFLVTLSPLWAGKQKIALFFFHVNGAINSVSTLAWLMISCLASYYYVTLRRR